MKTRFQSLLLFALLVIGVWLVGCATFQAAGVVSTLNTLVLENNYTPIPGSYQKLTALDVTQTLAVPTGAFRCIIYCEDDAVRVGDDGTDPDPATKIGGVIAAGQWFPYAGDLSAVELRGTAATIVHVWYYRR